MKTEIVRLYLASPLIYDRNDEADPFGWREDSGEQLFCFGVNPSQALEFEPDESSLLGPLIFGGKAPLLGREALSNGEEKLELPAGNYLFSQERDILNREQIIEMAVELQKEGLWQRLEPGPRLYLRYLFEDSRGVTQVLRPYSFKASTI